MSEQDSNKLPFDSEDPAEQALWAALEEIPRDAPSADLRRGFYRELEEAGSANWLLRVREWLGISGTSGWLTATACVVAGILIGQNFALTTPDEPARLEALEQNVALLNRELILDRLQDASASQRLQAVIDAGNVVQDDAEVARALLQRATEDRVYSIRSAAIEVLGPTLGTGSAAYELMSLLENAESPIVQLALVDLVLRNGSAAQLEHLRQLASNDRLHPDLVQHVNNSLGSETI